MSTTIFRQGLSTLLSSAVVDILAGVTGTNKAVDLLKNHFTFTAAEMAKHFQDGYGYALAAISSGLATPENQQGFWQTLFQSNINRELATRIEQHYLRPFAKQQGLTAAELQVFRQTAAQQCQSVAKRTLFQADNVRFSEAELASFVTSDGTHSITDLVLEQIQVDLDQRVVALLRYNELLGNALLLFLHEQLRKDERFNNTLAALQREGLMIDVREIKQIVQITEAKLNQAFAAKQLGEMAQLAQQLERLQHIESVTQTHYAQFLEFSQQFADWAQLLNVQLEQVLTVLGQVLGQLTQAEALFSNAYQQASNDEERALSQFNLFQVFIRQQVYEKAFSALQKAIKLNPQRYALHNVHTYDIQRILGAGGFNAIS